MHQQRNEQAKQRKEAAKELEKKKAAGKSQGKGTRARGCPAGEAPPWAGVQCIPSGSPLPTPPGLDEPEPARAAGDLYDDGGAYYDDGGAMYDDGGMYAEDPYAQDPYAQDPYAEEPMYDDGGYGADPYGDEEYLALEDQYAQQGYGRGY